MVCPTCRKEFTSTGDETFRPFCSERCKLIDLGRWAGGEYRIPTSERPASETQESNGHPEDTD